MDRKPKKGKGVRKSGRKASPAAVRDDDLATVSGGRSTGAGAGKVTFDPFSITRKIDRSSP